MNKTEYKQYLLSEKWEGKREIVLQMAAFKCQLCSKTESQSGGLQIHHNTYDRIGKELLSDLIALCPTCHKNYHSRNGDNLEFYLNNPRLSILAPIDPI